MLNRKKKMVGFVLILVLVVLFLGAKSGQETAVVQPEQRSGLPPYAFPGPQQVGKSDLVTDDENPLAMKIWYPALPDDNLQEGTVYPYEIKMGSPLGTVKIASAVGQATQDAPFDRTQSPYPLIILSPGFAIGTSSYGWLAEHLASYGFVVIAPEHQEHLDPGNELWRAAITRPKDILALLAAVDAAGEPGERLEGLIDPDVVAVTGHSYGGYTALVAAGAQIDTAGFTAHCANAAQTEDPTVWLCDMLLPHLTEMADLAGLDAIPQGLWPAWSDPRVDAVVSMAGDAFFFGQDGLAKINVPVMAVGGTSDSDTPFMWGPHPTYEYASSLKKARVALNDAEHMIFTNNCESITWIVKLVAGEFCSDSVWDRNEAHDLIKHLTTAFLLAELKQDQEAAALLRPDAVSFPGLSFQAEGY